MMCGFWAGCGFWGTAPRPGTTSPTHGAENSVAWSREPGVARGRGGRKPLFGVPRRVSKLFWRDAEVCSDFLMGDTGGDIEPLPLRRWEGKIQCLRRVSRRGHRCKCRSRHELSSWPLLVEMIREDPPFPLSSLGSSLRARFSFFSLLESSARTMVQS